MQVTKLELLDCGVSSNRSCKMDAEDQISGGIEDDQKIQIDMSINDNEIDGESHENISNNKQDLIADREINECKIKDVVNTCENGENAVETDCDDDKCGNNQSDIVQESRNAKKNFENECVAIGDSINEQNKKNRQAEISETIEISESEMSPQKTSGTTSYESSEVCTRVKRERRSSLYNYDNDSEKINSDDNNWALDSSALESESQSEVQSSASKNAATGSNVEVYELTDDDDDEDDSMSQRKNRGCVGDEAEEEAYNDTSSLDEDRSILSDDIDALNRKNVDQDDYDSDDQIVHSIDSSDDELVESVSPERNKRKKYHITPERSEEFVKIKIKKYLKEKIWKRKESDRHIYFSTKRSINWYVLFANFILFFIMFHFDTI